MRELPPIYLPIPPSANSLFVAGGGGRRFKAADYRKWMKLLTYPCLEYKMRLIREGQKEMPILGRIGIKIWAPRNRRRDLDNYIKPTLDGLVSFGILRDDSDVESVEARWDDSFEDRITVVITIEDHP